MVERRKRLILHVGMHKTGSTSLQAALSAGRLPDVHTFRLGRPNHSLACVLMFEDAPETYFAFRNRGSGAGDVAAARDVVAQRLARQLKKRPEPSFVLTAERVSSAPAVAVQRLHRYFSQYFETIDVYGYVRPPAGFLASMFQQSLKTGQVRFDLSWPNYRQRFEKLDQIFGRDHVHLRPFDPRGLYHGNLVSDFAEWTGIELQDTTAPQKNQSISAAAVALIACYRRNRARLDAVDRGAARDRQIIGALRGVGSAPFALLPARVAQEITAHRDDLAWIDARLGLPLSRGIAPAVADAVVIGSEADLKRAAARFSPLLSGGSAAAAIPVDTDPDRAEAQAWGDLAAYVKTLPTDAT